jgi:protein arginine N-methyltransferase 2
MMGWEAPLMEKHAAAICRGGGGHCLNVGFGLGIVDNEIQVGGTAQGQLYAALQVCYKSVVTCSATQSQWTIVALWTSRYR